MNKIISLLPVIGILGCASHPEDIATAYVSPIQYQSFSCSQIEAELQRVNRRASDLQGTLQETADNDSGQMAVGLILFWPALFFLEGGDGPQAQEYARLKGERDALEQSAIQKNCGLAGEQLAATGPNPGAELQLSPEGDVGGSSKSGGSHGAIAISTRPRLKSGACTNQATAELAQACALRECGPQCEISAVFGDNQCAAAVGHPGVIEVAVEATSSSAAEAAKSQCRVHPRRGRVYSNCQLLERPSCNLG